MRLIDTLEIIVTFAEGDRRRVTFTSGDGEVTDERVLDVYRRCLKAELPRADQRAIDPPIALVKLAAKGAVDPTFRNWTISKD